MNNSRIPILPERRRHIRFFPNQDAFAALGSEYSKVGKIVNISKGGLVFEYTAFRDTKEENVSVEIFLTTGEVHIYHVPCQVIHDEGIDCDSMQERNLKLWSSRLCNIQFTGMTKDQEREIELFISTYTRSA
ncbi:MAG: PilZ domain-containing protein [Deltaproteobacteria bacterium]|nr:PilZ domain-containing protein [Deltaproteobacteria bacterium]